MLLWSEILLRKMYCMGSAKLETVICFTVHKSIYRRGIK